MKLGVIVITAETNGIVKASDGPVSLAPLTPIP
jgi:hypothetical protein